MGVVKMEENEVDLLLQVVDMRNANSNNDDFNFKKDNVKIEPDYYDDASNYLEPDIEHETNDQDIEDVKYKTKAETSFIKSETPTDNQKTSVEANNDCHRLTCEVCHMIFRDNIKLKKHQL